MRRLTLITSGMLFTAILVVIWSRSRQIEPIELVPTITGQPEYCLTCHNDLPEISPSHPVETFGCVLCHGGQRLALDADLAHSTMRGGRNPSRLEVVEDSCGGSSCHSGDPNSKRDHIQRVSTSIQSTYAGAIANIRYTFGAQSDLKASQGIFGARDFDRDSPTGILVLTEFDPDRESNPSIKAFAENCLTCHITAEPLPGAQFARLTGCAACHTLSAGLDLDSLDESGKRINIHNLTTAIPYTQCNTCHNRGNYDLREMQFHHRTDRPTERLNDYYQPIAQFVRCEWTLDCVDCHTREEIMGDGNLYSNQKEIQYVQCRTCHGTLSETPRTHIITDLEDIGIRLAFLNPAINLNIGDTVIITEKEEPLWNARLLPDKRFELLGKVTNRRFIIPLVKGSGCQQRPDEQESRYCHQCHAVER